MMRNPLVAAPYLALASCAALCLASSAVLAQTQKGVPNALQGFSENRGKPVQIEAGTLEVRDRDKVATFSGKVNVTQGDTNMKANTVTLLGNVVVSKGQNVMKGERLVVNIDTGISTVEAGKTNGRVQMLLNPSDSGMKKPELLKPETGRKDAPKPAAGTRQSPIY